MSDATDLAWAEILDEVDETVEELLAVLKEVFEDHGKVNSQSWTQRAATIIVRAGERYG